MSNATPGMDPIESPVFPIRFRHSSGSLCLACPRCTLLDVCCHYGYFRDELYYLACGEHPGWGYVDQPPLIGWMAWLLQHTIGTSLTRYDSCQCWHTPDLSFDSCHGSRPGRKTLGGVPLICLSAGGTDNLVHDAPLYYERVRLRAVDAACLDPGAADTQRQ